MPLSPPEQSWSAFCVGSNTAEVHPDGKRRMTNLSPNRVHAHQSRRQNAQMASARFKQKQKKSKTAKKVKKAKKKSKKKRKRKKREKMSPTHEHETHANPNGEHPTLRETHHHARELMAIEHREKRASTRHPHTFPTYHPLPGPRTYRHNGLGVVRITHRGGFSWRGKVFLSQPALPYCLSSRLTASRPLPVLPLEKISRPSGYCPRRSRPPSSLARVPMHFRPQARRPRPCRWHRPWQRQQLLRPPPSAS